jgi:hypothetical protein
MSYHRTRLWITALAAAQWIVPCAIGAQTPRIRVEFRLRDEEYRQAFSNTERQTVEDSATAMLARALGRHFRFVSFTPDSADATPRVLLFTLDQEDLRPSAPLGNVGLHILLRNPPDSTSRYWTVFRRAGADLDREAVTVETFLTELAVKLDGLVDADWDRLVSELLSRVSIADTADVAVWGTPASWLMPYSAQQICIDTKTGKLRVDNEQRTADGFEDREVITKVARFQPDSTRVPSQVFNRFKDHIHAKALDPAGLPSADSLRVRGVYILEYHFDAVRCATLTPPNTESSP